MRLTFGAKAGSEVEPARGTIRASDRMCQVRWIEGGKIKGEMNLVKYTAGRRAVYWQSWAESVRQNN